jgi:hypothetical protein
MEKFRRAVEQAEKEGRARTKRERGRILRHMRLERMRQILGEIQEGVGEMQEVVGRMPNSEAEAQGNQDDEIPQLLLRLRRMLEKEVLENLESGINEE